MGDEVEFTYKGKRYSVTYFVNDSKQEGISFCEFYKEPVEFYKAEDFMNNAKIENELLKTFGTRLLIFLCFNGNF